MPLIAFALFDTPVGPCGVAWRDDATLVGTQLPEGSVAATTERLAARFEVVEAAAPPSAVQDVIARMVASLEGTADDLADVELDLSSIPPFQQRVLDVVRRIPAGETMSYGEVAVAAGSPSAARAVGQALGRNPFPIVIPCHRVLAADGRIGGFTATGGVAVKAKLLAAEGITPRA